MRPIFRAIIDKPHYRHGTELQREMFREAVKRERNIRKFWRAENKKRAEENSTTPQGV